MSTVNPKISKIGILKIIIFSLVILAGLSVIEFSLFKQQPRIASICFQDSSLQESRGCFLVEIVSTPSQMQRGLMFRENMDQDKGMLFVFHEEGNYPFWMKNTLIPLDMIWIDQDSKVVFIQEGAEPCREINCPIINPQKNAKYVLEINGGIVKELKIYVGDKATLSY